MVPAAELWAALRTLAKWEKEKWKHETELLGLRTRLLAIATQRPALWAGSLPWILLRAREFGDVAQAVTLELASTCAVVRDAVDQACEDETEGVRLLARGLKSLLDGLDEPGAGLARTLADAAARYMDGTPVFPHPLGPVSATWLASTAVERVIADGVRRAAGRFAAEVREQGADVEEALTKALVKEIEIEFRQTLPKLKAMGTPRSTLQTPALSMKQRPASKSTEEPEYGCDLAWLLDAGLRRTDRSFPEADVRTPIRRRVVPRVASLRRVL